MKKRILKSMCLSLSLISILSVSVLANDSSYTTHSCSEDIAPCEDLVKYVEATSPESREISHCDNGYSHHRIYTEDKQIDTVNCQTGKVGVTDKKIERTKYVEYSCTGCSYEDTINLGSTIVYSCNN